MRDNMRDFVFNAQSPWTGQEADKGQQFLQQRFPSRTWENLLIEIFEVRNIQYVCCENDRKMKVARLDFLGGIPPKFEH